MCEEVIRVKAIYPYGNGAASIRCAGTVHSGYLHRGNHKLLQRFEEAMATNKELMVEQVMGAFVKIYSGFSPSVPARPVASTPQVKTKAPSRFEQHHKFLDIGGYTFICLNCGAKIYSTSEPRFCPKCRGKK